MAMKRERQPFEIKLQLERTVFFCDAVVAIAITLLALNLKLDHIPGKKLTFADLLSPWKTFAAFLLSFLNIASFWRTHHMFFAHIKKMNESLLAMNIGWLFFIILLPFSTSLVSEHFFDTPAIFFYSANVFLITIFQNGIWDYACKRENYFDAGSIDEVTKSRFVLFCNIDMINSAIAIVLSFINPALAFILLFTKLPMAIIGGIYLRLSKARQKRQSGN